MAGRLARAERIEQLFGDLQSGGYHPFHAPCGVLLDEAERARSTCIRCTWCDGYPCLVHAKSDAETIAVRPILDLPNVTLLVNAEVTHLRTDAAGGTVTGVDVTRGGAEEVYDADVVVVVGRRREQRQAPAALGERSAPERARQRLRPGGAQLHVPQLQGRRRDRRRSSTRPRSRRRSGSTTSTSPPTTTSGRPGTSRWSASRTPRR